MNLLSDTFFSGKFRMKGLTSRAVCQLLFVIVSVVVVL